MIMTVSKRAEELETLSSELDGVVERLIDAPLKTELLVDQLQAVAEKLSALAASKKAGSGRVEPLLSKIKVQLDWIRRLLDCASSLSCGLISRSDSLAFSYGATGERKPDPAGWRMRLEA